MKRSVTALLTLLFTLPMPASAKGPTVKIEISGSTLTAPLEITDASIVRQFSVYTGPGAGGATSSDSANQEGAFIDWPKGMLAERPKGMQSYDVKFYCARARAPHDVHIGYTVTYAYDHSRKGGYIYLPGPRDERAKLNTAVYHGVEGNWFRASSEWERLVRPLVEKAAAGDAQTKSE